MAALFTRKRSIDKTKLYMLMDRESKLLGRGERYGKENESTLHIRVFDGEPEAIAAAEIVQAVPSNDASAILMGKIISRHGSEIVIEPMRQLGAEVRRNFRMPVTFESFVYPAEGGRSPIKSKDLSCGGIAFYSTYEFNVGDTFEVVIPITEGGPLLLKTQVLRILAHEGPISLYACKFIDMIHDEESLLREAVFNIQLRAVRAPRSK